MIQNSYSDAVIQASNDREGEQLQKRYNNNKINIRDFDSNPNKVSEMDALIAYLQVLGTFIDFNKYQKFEHQANITNNNENK